MNHRAKQCWYAYFSEHLLDCCRWIAKRTTRMWILMKSVYRHRATLFAKHKPLSREITTRATLQNFPSAFYQCAESGHGATINGDRIWLDHLSPCRLSIPRFNFLKHISSLRVTLRAVIRPSALPLYSLIFGDILDYNCLWCSFAQLKIAVSLLHLMNTYVNS